MSVVDRRSRVAMGTYDEVAGEYYDASHVTSRNFDAATAAFMSQWDCPIPENGLVLDLGAGRGCARSYCGVPAKRIIQADISGKMLLLSPREPSRAQVQCDALRLPFAPKTFSAVTAFLCDAYNRPRLYSEVGRTLTGGGVFVGTLPHYEWGAVLRRLRGYSARRARFLTRSGRPAEVDSFLMRSEEMADCLAGNGLVVAARHDLRLPVSEVRVSPDVLAPAEFLGVSPYELPVVQLIVARKPR